MTSHSLPSAVIEATQVIAWKLLGSSSLLIMADVALRNEKRRNRRVSEAEKKSAPLLHEIHRPGNLRQRTMRPTINKMYGIKRITNPTANSTRIALKKASAA
jgi:hypothetical protein